MEGVHVQCTARGEVSYNPDACSQFNVKLFVHIRCKEHSSLPTRPCAH